MLPETQNAEIHKIPVWPWRVGLVLRTPALISEIAAYRRSAKKEETHEMGVHGRPGLSCAGPNKPSVKERPVQMYAS